MSAFTPGLIAWHYTTGEKYALILASGVLKPATSFVPPNEKPIIWFSLDPEWEPTANKAVFVNGVMKRLTKAETQIMGNGLYRFGVPAKTLHPWPKLASKARMASGIRQGLERTGITLGANPRLWCGLTSNPLPLAKVAHFQTLTAQGVWVDVKEAAQ